MGQGPWYSSSPTSALEATATARSAFSSPLHTHRPRHREPRTPLEPTRAKFKATPCPQGPVATGGGRGTGQSIGHLLIVPTSTFPTPPQQGSTETNLVLRVAFTPGPENHSSSPERAKLRRCHPSRLVKVVLGPLAAGETTAQSQSLLLSSPRYLLSNQSLGGRGPGASKAGFPPRPWPAAPEHALPASPTEGHCASQPLPLPSQLPFILRGGRKTKTLPGSRGNSEAGLGGS